MEYETIRVNRRAFAFRIVPYCDMGAPWEEHDGHGPVSEWESRAKLPGEIIINQDGESRRFYDFAAACQIARRDGWGFLPGKLRLAKVDGKWQAWVDGKLRRGPRGRSRREKLFFATAPEINAAIRAVYAAHRATMTAREYAAGAAAQDCERLRQWCADQWEWIGVEVAPIEGEDGPDWDASRSLWGIESDSPEYHREVAAELVD